MAVTPKTIFRNPAALAVGVLTVLGVGLVALYEYKVSSDCASGCPYAMQQNQPQTEKLDVGSYLEYDQPTFERIPSTGDVEPVVTTHGRWHAAACGYTEPESRWSESEWSRYIDCLEERGETNDRLLDATTRGLDQMGRSLELAVRKAELLEVTATTDEQLDFLEHALEKHDTPWDARLDEMYVHASVWRGEARDIDRASRVAFDNYRALLGTCRGAQTLGWMEYAMESRDIGPEVARSVPAGSIPLHAFINNECSTRIHEGRWNVIAEVVGAGILAEQINGHDGRSTLVRTGVESYEIRDVPALCEHAVPAQLDLRESCENRVRREIALTR